MARYENSVSLPSVSVAGMLNGFGGSSLGAGQGGTEDTGRDEGATAVVHFPGYRRVA